MVSPDRLVSCGIDRQEPRLPRNVPSVADVPSNMKLREIPFKTMEGTETSLSEFDGKALLIVNVASRCGLAPQYATLEKLQ